MTLVVDRALAENYAAYYQNDPDLTAWRRLGAADKGENILRLCSNLPHTDVLEIGCGDGAVLERLRHLNFAPHLTGLEISSSAVHEAKARNIRDVQVQLFDGYQLPFPERQFDLAILTHVIEHVEYPRKLIREAGKVARYVFVEVPLEDNWRLSNDFAFDRVGHINFYSPKTFRRLVQSCGMQVLNAHLCHSSPACYVYRKGKIHGRSSYFMKELLLRSWPNVATKIFTYHYSLVYAEAGC